MDAILRLFYAEANILWWGLELLLGMCCLRFLWYMISRRDDNFWGAEEWETILYFCWTCVEGKEVGVEWGEGILLDL